MKIHFRPPAIGGLRDQRAFMVGFPSRPASTLLNRMSLFDLRGRLQGLRVLVRTDLNVLDPQTGWLKADADARIEALIPLLQFLRAEGALAIVISSGGQPQQAIRAQTRPGFPEAMARRTVLASWSLQKIADRLRELMRPSRAEVIFATASVAGDALGEDLFLLLEYFAPGRIVLLENLGFYREEESRNEAERLAFAQKIVRATHPHVYVLDTLTAAVCGDVSATVLPRLVRESRGLVVVGNVDSLEGVKVPGTLADVLTVFNDREG